MRGQVVLDAWRRRPTRRAPVADARNARTSRSRAIGLALALLLGSAGCGGDGGQGLSGPVAGGNAARIKLSAPEALLLDPEGNLYVSEFKGARVVKIARDGRLAVVAGTGTQGYSGDGARAVAAQLSEPSGLALDSEGDLAIADYGNNVIRKVDPRGLITTVEGSSAARLNHPIGLAFHGTDLYVADAGNGRVVMIDASGSLHGIDEAVSPAYLLLDGPRKLYTSDHVDNRVLQIDIGESEQHVSLLIAGSGGAGGFSGDEGPATEAQFNVPYGLATDAHGNLYVADLNNNRVRRIDREGIVTTIAGTGVQGFAGDHGPATAAKLDMPVGLATDALGNLYIADQGNNRVRRVDANGVITTVAGVG